MISDSLLFPNQQQQRVSDHDDSSGRRISDDRRGGDDIRKGGDTWGSDRGGYSSRGPGPSDRYSNDYRRSGSGSGRFDSLGGPRGPGMAPGMARTTITPSGVIVKRTGGGIQVGEHTGYLRMRGLPFSAAKEDIYDFFKEYSPILDSIVLTFRSDGRATGEAYVGFETPEDSKRAMELHRKSMGSRYIELFLSNRDEHARAMVRFGDR
jgi:heterogeneous nuclear ribonucleoprotein F/H